MKNVSQYQRLEIAKMSMYLTKGTFGKVIERKMILVLSCEFFFQRNYHNLGI
jgi:hypothetical protein